MRIDGHFRIRGPGKTSHKRQVGPAGTSRVPVRCWNLSVHERTTFWHCFQYEKIMKRSLKDKNEEDHTLPPRPSEVCIELPLGYQAGGVLAIGPCFTVRHWSVTQATVSLSSAESEAKAMTKGCTEALYVKHLLEHQTSGPFKIEVWTDSSAKAIMQRLGPGRRAKHLEVQTLWVQQLVKIGLISLNKVDTLENCADVFDKTRDASCTRQVSWNDGLHISW